MLAFKTGYSDKTDSFLAGIEAVDNALKNQVTTDASLVIVFHTSRHTSAEISRGIIYKLGNQIKIIGGYAVGVITNNYIGYSGYQVGVAIFMGQSSYWKSFMQASLADNEQKIGELLAKDITPYLSQISGMFLFYDSVNRVNGNFKLNMATPLLKGMSSEWQDNWPKLAGAGLVGDMQCQETFQIFNNTVHQQAAMALAFCPPLEMDTKIIHGCTPLGSYHTITKADHNTILEINNEPALDAVAKILGTSNKTWKEYAFFLTFGVNKDEKWKDYNEELYVNRLCLKIDEKRKGIVMFEPDLKKGDEIQLMQRQINLSNIKNKCKKLIDSLDGKEPLLAFYINCAGRAASYCGLDEEDATAIQEVLGDKIPLLGIYSGVEIAPIKTIPTPLDWTGVICIISARRNLVTKNLPTPNEITQVQNELQSYIDQQKVIQNQLDEAAGKIIQLDYKISQTKHQLKQKQQGYKLINQLHKSVGSVEDKEIMLNTVLELITVGLNMDQTVLFLKQSNYFVPANFLGFSKEQVTTLIKQNYQYIDDLEKKPILVNKSILPNDFINQIKKDFSLPYFILVPVFSHDTLIGWLLAGRQQELNPFRPPFDQGDLDTLETIAGFISIRIDNISLVDNLRNAHTNLEEMNKSLEKKVQDRTAQLDKINKDLENAIKEIKETQAQVVHAEKMAGLGQLIAGISHEINTPAGAIVNAIAEIKTDYAVLLNELIEFAPQLNDSLQSDYLKACQMILNHKREISTSEGRQIAKVLEKYFEDNGVENARVVSKNLSLIGFDIENVSIALNLLKSSYQHLIHEHFFKLGMTQIHVRDIELAITRIVSLVKALKLYSHAGEVDLAQSNLREDIENTLIILHNKLKRGVVVHQDYDNIPPFECYADQLNQVWTNLINNAIEAMKGTGNLWIRTKNIEDGVVVEVEDDGPGIPEEIIFKIFEPYFTTKPKGEGTGLGLAITKSIIDKHHGKIDVTSQPGKTKFIVFLPIKKITKE